jgi:hypothetical protein
MKRLLFILLASLVVVSGCKSSPKKRVSGTIAADVEEEFKQRWIAQRMADLTAATPGLEPREARKQAVQDFRQRFSHTDAAKRADPMGDVSMP